MNDIDNQIYNQREKIKSLIKKKKEVIEGGLVGNTKMTYKDFLNTKVEDIKRSRDRKKDLLNKMDNIMDQINNLEAERQTLRKQLSKEYTTPEEIKKAIEDYNKRYETTTLNNAAEKKIISDIQFLKKSLPYAEQLLTIKPKIDKLYDQKKAYRDELNVIKDEIQGKSAELDKVRKEIEDVKEQRQDIQQQLDKYEEEIQKVKEGLDGLYTKRNEIKEEYYKAKLEYEIEYDEVKRAEYIIKEKTRLKEKEEYISKKIEERKQALLDRPNPYQKEIETCEHLIALCNKLKVQFGLA